MAKSHSDSEAVFFNSFEHWTDDFRNAGIEIGPVTFLWITDGAPSVVYKEKSDRDMR